MNFEIPSLTIILWQSKVLSMYLLMKNMYLSNENDIIFINIIKLHITTFNLIYYLIGLMKDLSAEKSLSDTSLFVLFEWKPTAIVLLKTMESTTKKQWGFLKNHSLHWWTEGSKSF